MPENSRRLATIPLIGSQNISTPTLGSVGGSTTPNQSSTEVARHGSVNYLQGELGGGWTAFWPITPLVLDLAIAYAGVNRGQAVDQDQVEVCRRSMSFSAADPFSKVGISEGTLQGEQPLNGLRHPPENGTCGWYIWSGPEFFLDDDEFFKRCTCLIYHSVAWPSYPIWGFLLGGGS